MAATEMSIFRALCGESSEGDWQPAGNLLPYKVQLSHVWNRSFLAVVDWWV